MDPATPLTDAIEAAALPRQMTDGTVEACIPVQQVETLAVRFACTGREVEIAALQHGVIPERYARNFNTFDRYDQIRLLNATVTVVGLGGLGGAVIECLARAGVGTLKLVDGDHFEDHNLNRQLLCTQDQVGNAKAQAAAERVCRINSTIAVQGYQTFLTSENVASLIEGSDVAVDCLDDIETRFILETGAKAAGIPLVSAALAGLGGHVTVIYPEDPGLTLIYGERSDLSQTTGAETVLGCLPQTAQLIGAAESNEVLKVLLGKVQDTLRNRMLMIDAGCNLYEVLDLT